MKENKTQCARRQGLDTLRGFTLISMIAYHTSWDLVYLFGVSWSWYHSKGAYIWQQSICWTFILLSGYCWNLGRHRLKRGFTVFLGGVVISAVTYLFMPSAAIFFGVLSLLGSAMLLTIPLDGLLKRVGGRLGIAVCFLLFLLTRHVSAGYLSFGHLFQISLPAGLYVNYIAACFGFPPPGFVSADYFPLLPWLFLFWCGYYLYRLFPDSSDFQPRLPLVTAMGRQSLPIYLLHQPVVYGVLSAVFWLIGQ